VGGTLYFVADDGRNGQELWRSDGSSVGTWLVADIHPTGHGAYRLWSWDQRIVLAADDGQAGEELWLSDGTRPGTRLLHDIRPGPPGSSPRGGTAVRAAFYFHADDGARGRELWRTEGTGASTYLVQDIHPNGSADPAWLTALGNRLLFVADDGIHGAELWVTDGTTAGTHIVRDVHPGSEGSQPAELAVVPCSPTPSVLFKANDGSTGQELWVSDGAPAGTRPVADIRPGAGSSSPGSFAPLDGPAFCGVLFSANDGVHGYELWRSDGTPEGTEMVKDINTSAGQHSVPYELVPVGGRAFFGSTDGASGVELWVTDGTPEGTRLAGDVFPGPIGSWPEELVSWQDRALFSANHPDYGRELWASDGTPAGTELVADINPGARDSAPTWLVGIDQALFFRTNDGQHGAELWVIGELERRYWTYLPVAWRLD
jgi:ELWxxDGT repeat protein